MEWIWNFYLTRNTTREKMNNNFDNGLGTVLFTNFNESSFFCSSKLMVIVLDYQINLKEFSAAEAKDCYLLLLC